MGKALLWKTVTCIKQWLIPLFLLMQSIKRVHTAQSRFYWLVYSRYPRVHWVGSGSGRWVYSPLQTGASVSVTAGSNQAFPSPRLNPPPPSLFKAFHIDRKANTIMLGNQCYSWGESMKCKGKSHNVSLSAALHRLCQTCSIMQHLVPGGEIICR